MKVTNAENVINKYIYNSVYKNYTAVNLRTDATVVKQFLNAPYVFKVCTKGHFNPSWVISGASVQACL